jgi:transposase
MSTGRQQQARTDVGEAQMTYAAYVGLDWGSEKHSLCLRAADSNQVEDFELKHTPEDLHHWALKLRDRFAGGKVAVAIDQRKGAVINALLGYDFIRVFPINPQAAANYRRAFSPSGAKDDPVDARYLLDFVVLHRDRLRMLVPDSPESRALQRLVEFRRKTVDARVALTNRLTELLRQYFPQALDWVGELNSVMACDFLEKWPTLAKIQKAKPAAVRKFYQQHRCRLTELLEQRLQQICKAVPLTRDVAIVETSILMVQTIVRQLRPVIEAINRLDKEIETRFETHEDYQIFSSFPGAGPVLGARLQAVMGSDRSRFDSAGEVQDFSGIAPVTERSGKSQWVHQRFACPKFVRQSFHEFAAQSIRQSEWARAFYDKQRHNNKGHHAAIRALAYKWIRIVFRCWKDRVPYQESIYMEALKRNGVDYLEAA